MVNTERRSWPEAAASLAWLSNLLASGPPSTFFRYNNWDFNVLGAIFQKVTGTNLFEAFDAVLARPLGMEDFRPLDGRFWRDTTRLPAWIRLLVVDGSF